MTRFLLSLLLACNAFAADAPFLEKQDIFLPGDHGVARYRIPGIVVTPKGTVLAYCEARHQGSADWGEISVSLRRSLDGGKTWLPAQTVAHKGERIEGNPHKPDAGAKEQTVNNPVAIVDRKTGTIHFLYCINYARAFYQQSTDEGATFSAPVEITSTFEKYRPEVPWNCIATGPGHGIQLRNGRLLVPVWMATGKVGAHAPSLNSTIFSDDNGKTWQRGEVAIPNTKEWRNPNETVAAELADGGVMLNARSVSAPNRRLIVESADGATKWSAPRFDAALFEPICMGSLISIPKGESDSVLVFSNPHTLNRTPEGTEVPAGGGKRQNLSIKLSHDQGKTWSHNRTLEAGSSAYSDLAVLADGTILCFYEKADRISIARFNQAWVKESIAPTTP